MCFCQIVLVVVRFKMGMYVRACLVTFMFWVWHLLEEEMLPFLKTILYAIMDILM